MYYNTTNLESEQVTLFSNNNKTQDETILEIIKQLNRPFSASSIYKRYPIANVPITSIRRSINTLMKRNEIMPTGVNVQGLYGKPEKQYTHDTLRNITSN
jgi:hypothetical protein